jgi:hypothetical protein
MGAAGRPQHDREGKANCVRAPFGRKSLSARLFSGRRKDSLAIGWETICTCLCNCHARTVRRPGPWSINIPGVGYLRTPHDDIAFIYQDTLVALDTDRGINIGQAFNQSNR